MTDQVTLEVTAADREAASLYAWAEGDVGTHQLRYDIRQGRRDNHPLVEAFTRHRIAATRTPSPTTRVLVEALERLIPANVSLDNAAWPDSTILPLDVTLGELRAARHALSLARNVEMGEG